MPLLARLRLECFTFSLLSALPRLKKSPANRNPPPPPLCDEDDDGGCSPPDDAAFVRLCADWKLFSESLSIDSWFIFFV
jgi:hypothetical protein